MSEFSRPVSIAEIDRTPIRQALSATAAEERLLATRLGVEALSALTAKVTVAKKRGAILVTGQFRADIRQICVVTLEPFDARIAGEIDEAFLPAGAIEQVDEVEVDMETPEPLEGDSLDLGELVAQYLALEIDPHPRADAADLAALEAPISDEADPSHPFAALGKLKQKS